MPSCLNQAWRSMVIFAVPALVAAAAYAQAPQPPLTCIAQPATVFPGDPVQVEAHAMDLASGSKQPLYTWTSTGGRIAASDTGARIDTAGVAAGDYVVTGKLRNGRRTARNAACTAAFRVVAFAPPELACSANPTAIVPGGFVSITATARSLQNRPLTYSYGTSGGQITGTGPTASLAATDVNPGPLKITCNVVDDRGQAASTTITIDVRTPPPPPLAPPPAVRALCTASFARDHKRPVRVDNEAKGCLDDIALQLTREPGATLVIVGKHDVSEKPEAAAERALNIRQYMTDEKRIDTNRIQVRSGESTGRLADNLLVPQGATWDPAGTAGFDPAAVQRHGEPYSRDGH